MHSIQFMSLVFILLATIQNLVINKLSCSLVCDEIYFLFFITTTLRDKVYVDCLWTYLWPAMCVSRDVSFVLLCVLRRSRVSNSSERLLQVHWDSWHTISYKYTELLTECLSESTSLSTRTSNVSNIEGKCLRFLLDVLHMRCVYEYLPRDSLFCRQQIKMEFARRRDY